MTTYEKLTFVKVLTGISGTANDAALTVYLSLAENKILRRAYPYDTDVTIVPKQYEHLQLEIAVYLWNKRGSEGQTGHNENSVNRYYESADVPDSLLSHITPCVGVFREAT